jgi:DNA-directed RNA polymerase subunit RPC12/RpoP
MSAVGFTRPGLLCVQCGEPFTLSRTRPDASRIEDLSDPFQAACPECAHEAAYRKSAIQLMLPVDGP